MVEYQVIVAFCGPWLVDGRFPNPGERGNQRYDARVEPAIRAALEFPEAALLICGDGNNGLDVAAFARQARERGVRNVVRPRAQTSREVRR